MGSEMCIRDSLSAERNLGLLNRSRAFLYAQFVYIDRPTGAHIELGLAFGLGIPVVMITAKDIYLPYLLTGFGAVAASVEYLPRTRIYEVESASEAARLIAQSGPGLFAPQA